MTDDVRYERLVRAQREQVFDAFTSPDGQRAFYGRDDPGWITQSECEVRVGGVWMILFGPAPDQLYRHQHVFKVIDRPRRLLLSTTEMRLDGATLRFETEFAFEERRRDTDDDDPAWPPYRAAARRARPRRSERIRSARAIHPRPSYAPGANVTR